MYDICYNNLCIPSVKIKFVAIVKFITAYSFIVSTNGVARLIESTGLSLSLIFMAVRMVIKSLARYVATSTAFCQLSIMSTGNPKPRMAEQLPYV